MFVALLVSLVIPLGLDLFMPVPETNPITAEKVDLGRRLFFDRRLSADASLACASCHRPELGFSESLPVSIGVFGRTGQRNAPAIINRGYGRAFFWDGRTSTLEEQVLRPIGESTEMGSDPEAAAARVGLTSDELARALASYVRSILAGDSPFDRYGRGDQAALTHDQELGLTIFRRKGNCIACHIGPTLTDEAFHNTGAAIRNGRLADLGRSMVTGRDEDRGSFKTPTLREVARTGPFMHDGSIQTLQEVVEFYDRGGNPNPQLDPLIRPLGLTSPEKGALVAFLMSLSGRVTEGSRSILAQTHR
jgi:cytochrome c peroxidase